MRPPIQVAQLAEHPGVPSCYSSLLAAKSAPRQLVGVAVHTISSESGLAQFGQGEKTWDARFYFVS